MGGLSFKCSLYSRVIVKQDEGATGALKKCVYKFPNRVTQIRQKGMVILKQN